MRLTCLLFTSLFYCHILAQDNLHLPYLADGVIDTTLTETLGIPSNEATKTITIYSPTDSTWHYSNGAVLTAYKNSLYCMWQSSHTDEDAPETSVVYSQSTDEGLTWSLPKTLKSANDSSYCTSGGWIAKDDTLTAFINVWPNTMTPIGGYTYYMHSIDGTAWSKPALVRMADGEPMTGVIEQDTYRLPDGRLIGAAHFQPGLHVSPIYTDSSTGCSGWKRADFKGHDRGKQSRELEPSVFRQKDGTLVMVFRDQASSYRKMASLSHDRGVIWTEPQLTNIPDARVKQSAGNLPDGTVYLAGNPTRQKRRWPLAVLLSHDGVCFDKTILLRSGGYDLQPRRYSGKAKTLGYNYPKSIVYHNKLYVCYATNKEDVECTIINLDKIIGVHKSLTR